MNRNVSLIFSLGLVAALLAGCEDDDKPRIGGFCSAESDCPSGQQCLDGRCMGTCIDSTACDDGFACVDNVCVEQCASRDTCPQGRSGKWGCVEEACTPLEAPGFVEAGEPIEANEGQVVVLDAFPQSQPLSLEEQPVLEWEFIASEPAGTEVLLEVRDKADALATPAAQFTAPTVTQDTVLRFALTMRDSSDRTATDEIEVTVRNSTNEPPTAAISAPSDTAKAGDRVVVSAAGAADPNPDAVLTYAWTIEGADVSFADASDAQDMSAIAFIAPSFLVEVTLVVRVTVSDGTDSDTAELVITVAASDCDASACDDGNPCTSNQCNADGCIYPPNPDGTPCDDGDACTAPDTCSAGACGAGADVCNECEGKECDDGNPCTVDTCEEGGECVHTSSPGAPCDDGDACTSDDACMDGDVCAGTPISCDSTECAPASCEEGACIAVLKPVGTVCVAGESVGMCGAKGTCVVPSSKQYVPVVPGFENFSVLFSQLNVLDVHEGKILAGGAVDLSFFDGEFSDYFYGGLIVDITNPDSEQVEGTTAWSEVRQLVAGLAITWSNEPYRNFGEGWQFDEILLSKLGNFGWPRKAFPTEVGPKGATELGFIFHTDSFTWPLTFCATADGAFSYCTGIWTIGESNPIGVEAAAVFPGDYGLSGVGPKEIYAFTKPESFPAFDGDYQSAIYHNPSVLTESSWSTDEPLGCNGAAPCNGVSGWVDVHAESPSNILVAANPAQLLTFDGGWSTEAVGGVPSAQYLELQAMWVTATHAWFAAEADACGLVCFEEAGCDLGCAGFGQARTSLLLAKHLGTGEWITPHVLGVFDCGDDASGSCLESLFSFGLDDIVATANGDLVIIGRELVFDGEGFQPRPVIFRAPIGSDVSE